jgi:hypothetical protein
VPHITKEHLRLEESKKEKLAWKKWGLTSANDNGERGKKGGQTAPS